MGQKINQRLVAQSLQDGNKLLSDISATGVALRHEAAVVQHVTITLDDVELTMTQGDEYGHVQVAELGSDVGAQFICAKLEVTGVKDGTGMLSTDDFRIGVGMTAVNTAPSFGGEDDVIVPANTDTTDTLTVTVDHDEGCGSNGEGHYHSANDSGDGIYINMTAGTSGLTGSGIATVTLNGTLQIWYFGTGVG